MIIVGTPYTKGAGYLLNNQNSKHRQEADMKSCTHCQTLINMQEWKQEGAWCGKCFAPICKTCGAIAEQKGCEPFLKKLEAFAEKQMRFQALTR